MVPWTPASHSQGVSDLHRVHPLHGEGQSLCIDQHRIKVFALRAMGIDSPDVHETAAVSERWL